ncbi:hemin uptake protein HemP [Brucella haematophila]|nr:hemin uptake protein HemP [Brucella haematophila]KAB2700379.1 hemin uptake protein HemP [Ochrobactrum sp. Kaboul]TMV06211.1 hemin uptake protein HemP [Brucella haematophila]
MNRRIHIDMQVRLPRGHAADRSANRMIDGPAIDNTGERAAPTIRATLKDAQIKTYGSRELFDGSREVGIEHGGSLYRLKITRQGKLILNK